MSEEKKYYDPKTEEFHVGFEYQIRFSDHGNPGPWIDMFSKSTHELWTRSPEYTSKNVKHRVKCLDREDIEGFGFEDPVGAGIFFRKRIHMDEEIHLNFDSKILIERCCATEEDPIEVVFKGKIKNKSELKKILEQLEIV